MQMSNEKLQPQNSPIRQGEICLGLERKLSTEKFQNIVIHYDLTEKIEWQDLAEREAKVMNWTTIITREFQQIHDRVLGELKLSHKKAYFVDNIQEQDVAKDGLDDLDSLDDLDTV